MLLSSYFGLFSQPIPYNSNYYYTYSYMHDSEKSKKLKEYRNKFESVGLPLGKQYDPYCYSDHFYYKGINLDRIDKYKEIGLFYSRKEHNEKWYRKWLLDIDDKILNPIIVIGKLTSFNRKYSHDDVAEFKICKIIKGSEYYDKFPETIKAYSCLGKGRLSEYIKDEHGKEIKVEKETYFNKIGPTSGDEFVLYLDVYSKNNLDFYNKDENEFGRINVFYNVEAVYLDYERKHYIQNNKTEAQVVLEELLGKLKILNELKLKS